METAGVQVSVRDGKIDIELEAGPVAGRGKIVVQSLDNTVRGEVSIEILHGPPSYTSDLWNLGIGGNYCSFISDEIFDIYGNPVRSGFVTVDVVGGVIISPDVQPQIQVSQGRVYFVVKPVSGSKTTHMEICIYDEDRINLLICREFDIEVKSLPVTGKCLITLLMLIVGVLLLTNRVRKSKDIRIV